jgi:hypothetical protein
LFSGPEITCCITSRSRAVNEVVPAPQLMHIGVLLPGTTVAIYAS